MYVLFLVDLALWKFVSGRKCWHICGQISSAYRLPPAAPCDFNLFGVENVQRHLARSSIVWKQAGNWKTNQKAKSRAEEILTRSKEMPIAQLICEKFLHVRFENFSLQSLMAFSLVIFHPCHWKKLRSSFLHQKKTFFSSSSKVVQESGEFDLD